MSVIIFITPKNDKHFKYSLVNRDLVTLYISTNLYMTNLGQIYRVELISKYLGNFSFTEISKLVFQLLRFTRSLIYIIIFVKTVTKMVLSLMIIILKFIITSLASISCNSLWARSLSVFLNAFLKKRAFWSRNQIYDRSRGLVRTRIVKF